jgi:hypothetical protein
MSTYIGQNAESILASLGERFFYGLRRTDDGELFFGRVDKMLNTDSLTINKPGDPTENYPNFVDGQDFFEGRDAYHNIVYDNLNYEQYRWDQANIYYYINDEGELVASVGREHVYDDGSSSLGLEV